MNAKQRFFIHANLYVPALIHSCNNLFIIYYLHIFFSLSLCFSLRLSFCLFLCLSLVLITCSQRSCFQGKTLLLCLWQTTGGFEIMTYRYNRVLRIHKPRAIHTQKTQYTFIYIYIDIITCPTYRTINPRLVIRFLMNRSLNSLGSRPNLI